MRTILASLLYFAAVFAAGVALGAVRALLLEPRLGAVPAVLLELPVMLAISWTLCGVIIRRLMVPAGAGRRAAMGGLAFLLLIAAEAALAILGFAEAPAAFLARLAAPPGLLGLAGQVLFALMPLARR